MTIEEFANLYNYGTYIIRTNGHLTCVINNVLYDIWNCKDEEIDIVWQVEK